jgi:hypothetical protein
VGGGGWELGVACSEEWLNKNRIARIFFFSSKRHIENSVLLKTSETKKIDEVFCKAFLIFKKYFAQGIIYLFLFKIKRSFWLPAVRLRFSFRA